MGVSSTFGTTSSIPLNLALPGYRLRRQVYSDATGLCFDAEQESLGRKLTVKVLKPEYEDHRVARRQFLAEIDLVTPLVDAHLALVLDSQRKGTLALMTERVFLWTLESLLEPRLPLGEALALKHARDIAFGLHGLTSESLAYRNLTPRFVSVGDDGCRLAVLGGVIEMEQLAALRGKMVQDVNYVAPEQLGGEQPIGPAVHTYQLGALMFHMIAGSPPHTAGVPMSIAQAHYTKPFPSLKSRQPFLTEGVYDLVAACTQRVPEKRPSLDRVADTIGSLLEVDPKPRAPKPQRKRGWRRRR